MQDIRLNNPQQVKRLINRTINDLLKDNIDDKKARCIGYLSQIMLKAIETEELEKRLEALEEQLKGSGTA